MPHNAHIAQARDACDVTKPASAAISEILDRLTVPEQFIGIQGVVDDAFRQHGQALIGALIEAITRDETQLRVAASAVLLSLAHRQPEWCIASTVLETAAGHISRWFRASDDELRIWLCIVIIHLRHPHPVLLPMLSSLLDSNDEELSILASAGLLPLRPTDPHLVDLVAQGALKDNMAIVVSCSLSLSGEALVPRGLISRIKTNILSGSDREQDIALTSLLFIGPAASRAASAVRTVIADSSREVLIRGYAALVLGKISPNSRSSASVLVEASLSRETLLSRGAAAGLATTGRVPKRTLDGLRDHLRSGDERSMRAALSAVSELGSHAASLTPVLLECIDRPMSFELHSEFTASIASIGPSAIPSLLSEMESGMMARFTACSSVLVQLGRQGVTALSAAVETTESDWMLAALVAVVRELGPDASDAVPILAKHLEETYSAEILRGILQAIGTTGEGALQALPSIVECLHRSDSVVTGYAEQILRGLGRDAVDALENAIRYAEGPEQERLQRVLARLWHSHDSRYAYLAALENDSALRSFVYVADMIQESDGPVSTSQMEKLLRERVKAGLIPPDTPVSKRTLGLHVEALEEQLGRTLTTRIPGRKGTLTADGYKLLDDARAYLASKLQRGSQLP